MTPHEWILSSDTGISSKTIWAVMMGAVTGKEHPFTFDVPHDTDDFGRCYRLLQHFPEWITRLHEVAETFPKWKPMVRKWDKLTQMYEENLSIGKNKNWSNIMYRTMQELEDEGRLEDGWHKTGQCSWEKEAK